MCSSGWLAPILAIRQMCLWRRCSWIRRSFRAQSRCRFGCSGGRAAGAGTASGRAGRGTGKVREQSSVLEAEIVDLRRQVAVTKAERAATLDEHDYDEATTRDRFIDVLLKEAGWALDRPEDREYPVTGMPNAQGRGFVATTWLWGEDGKPLGLVEASAPGRDAKVGQQQAMLYADCLEAQFGQRPVIFYTNGYEHWLWDDTAYPRVRSPVSTPQMSWPSHPAAHYPPLAGRNCRSTNASSSGTISSGPFAASARRSRPIGSCRRWW